MTEQQQHGENVRACAEKIRAAGGSLQPRIAIVLGSGLGGLAARLQGVVTVSYRELPGFPVPTVAGHAGTLLIGKLDGVPVIVLNGRKHFYETSDPYPLRTMVRAVKAAGGRVVGVIPEFMKSRELAYLEADELVTVKTMRERKQLMEERASAFVTLPGGIGTVEEFMEIITLRYINQLAKPVVLVNQDGFYDDLLRFFERMTAEKFKSPGLLQLFDVAPRVEDVWPLLETAKPFAADELWR